MWVYPVKSVRKIAALALVFAVSAVSFWAFGGVSRFAQSASASKEPPVPVTITTAQKQAVSLTLSTIGTVQAANTVQIRARVDGMLESVNFSEGQIVNKGDLLAQIDPRVYKSALAQTKAKLAQDEAQLASDQRDLERSEQLGERAFASKQSIDQQRASVKKGNALVLLDKALIESAEVLLSYTDIVAPFTGRIGLRAVDAGNIVRASETTPIATLTQHQPIYVLFSLPENQLAAVRKASGAGTVPITAYDQDSTQTIAKGELRVIDNQIDTTTGTVRLKAEFANHDNALWPGQFVPVTIGIASRNDVVALPNAAIQRGPKGLFVWMVNAEKLAKVVPVNVGPMQGDLTIIESGVNPGDRVVISGQYRLRPDAPVQIEETKVPARENVSAK
jgi:membrane fusion protein, multidrug efflux system